MKQSRLHSGGQYGAWSALLLVVLGGCHSGTVEPDTIADVQQWINTVQTSVKAAPVAVPARSSPASQIASLAGSTAMGIGNPDPFNPTNVSPAFRRGESTAHEPAPSSGNNIAATPTQRIRMVGTLEQTGVRYALLQIGPLLQRVAVGETIADGRYRVQRISAIAVELEEPGETGRRTRLELAGMGTTP
ncbi:pilus assembly protein PilP [Herbaspirillum sp. RTI4]|uniref:pilus assembly protein PilP n=1 Tax=Herbaspirillum sp. RTI4 TaxID=3048640 RepID=UPI002AB48564|nr:pilus assembly protein PilP [Herbaspirillum sp. RTI4]MDY7576874.1 pilus assembly protein PilP [Herbaspirillum sp. RTI4]MEA9982519.1 pilus assembly protein PilP [Herbaspirillum sp. RTI4]